MYAHNLVTVDEKDMLLECSNKHRKARIGQVLQNLMLDTKVIWRMQSLNNV